MAPAQSASVRSPSAPVGLERARPALVGQSRARCPRSRYMVAFIYPITATIRSFLAKKGHALEDVDRMHQAWFKSIVMQVALWSVPYIREGDY